MTRLYDARQFMSKLLVRSDEPDDDGCVMRVTPASAGWRYVGFDVYRLGEGKRIARTDPDRETCVVVLAGRVHASAGNREWRDVGERATVFDGPPTAFYVPPATAWSIEAAGDAEVAVCTAPAETGAELRLLTPADMRHETRGTSNEAREIDHILMEDEPAESLLVTEVVTPAGHWSSYPPHKHDVDDPPRETLLEETYYHRIAPERGFGLQRVYTADRALDETLAFSDRDCVLVPRGYHTVSAPPGYALYYLNVMAGPTRHWAIANDPDHEWTMTPQPASR
jgi:5-deoxy-glucuronate isomerase